MDRKNTSSKGSPMVKDPPKHQTFLLEIAGQVLEAVFWQCPKRACLLLPAWGQRSILKLFVGFEASSALTDPDPREDPKSRSLKGVPIKYPGE